ncbi:hypothetical protein AN958_12245 [Leucoagaricus sp. SymC.cos]|nr:hypothetical protein AN958_12245 [Leucoagaricus sp. SymC.cos]
MAQRSRPLKETGPLDFSSIPTEILISIMTELDWKDVLTIRRTCKQLYNISRVKLVWERLLERHIEMQPKPFAVLDRPIAMYTNLELEQRFLRWKRGEMVCQDHSLPNLSGLPQELYKDGLEPTAMSTYLLRGRWFLSCESWGGDVAYYDLDPPKNFRTKGRILIPLPFEGHPSSIMSIEEDYDSPLLAFTIALVHIHAHDFLQNTIGVTGESRIDIWRGNLLLDEHNQGTDIQVQHIARFPLLARLGEPLYSMSLLGPLVAFNVNNWAKGSDVVIFDWNDTDSHSHCLRKTIRYEKTAKIDFLCSPEVEGLSDFNSIPTEILINIIAELDWRDVLNIRQTCKRLHNASKAKSIWERLFERHTQRQPKPFAVLERPFTMYSSFELEQWFTRWKRGEIICQDHSLPLRPGLPQKRIAGDSEPSSTYLLRGRWFLTCETFGGFVNYFDLDPPENTSTRALTLIPQPIRRNPMSVMSVEEDWESPLLSFTIALVHIIGHDFLKCFTDFCGESRIDIWRGSLVLDEYNQGRGLQVEHIAQIPLLARLGEPMLSISQLGSLVAFDVRSEDQPEGSDVVIFDWKDTSSFSRCLRKTIRYDEYGFDSSLRLLPNDRIIVANRSSVKICDHSLIPKLDTRPNVCNMVPLIEIECSFDLSPTFSRTFFFPDYLRLVFRRKTGIYGLTLKEDKHGALMADVSELLVFPPHCPMTEMENCRPYLTYNYALCWPRLDEGCVILASYDWPGECQIRKTGCSMREADHALSMACTVSMDVTSGNVISDTSTPLVEELTAKMSKTSLTSSKTYNQDSNGLSTVEAIIRLIQEGNLTDEEKIEIVRALLPCSSTKPAKTPTSKLMTDQLKVMTVYGILEMMSGADRLKTTRHLVKQLDEAEDEDWIDDMEPVKIALKRNRQAYKQAKTNGRKLISFSRILERHDDLLGILRFPRLLQAKLITTVEKQLKRRVYPIEVPSSTGDQEDRWTRRGVLSPPTVREDTNLLQSCVRFWDEGVYVSREILLDKDQFPLKNDGPVYKKVEPYKKQSEMRSRTFIDVWLHALWQFQQAVTGASRIFHELDITGITPVSITYNGTITMLTGRTDYAVIHPRLREQATRDAMGNIPIPAKKVMELNSEKDVLESIRFFEGDGSGSMSIQILLLEAKRRGKAGALYRHEPQVVAQCIACLTKLKYCDSSSRQSITYCLTDGFTFSFGLVVAEPTRRTSHKFTVYPTEGLSYDLSDEDDVIYDKLADIFKALVFWVRVSVVLYDAFS